MHRAIEQKETKVTKRKQANGKTLCVSIGPRQEQTAYPIHKLRLVEVNNQANGRIKQLHVAHGNGLVYRQNRFDSLDFHQQSFAYENVESQRFLELEPFVFDAHFLLADGRNASQLQFAQQAPFINTLQ